MDHKDQDPVNNNRIENLRVATRTQNQGNVVKRANCTSPFKGVAWHKPQAKWRAQIQFGKKKEHLGYFDHEHEAALAYNKRATELFGEFAVLNRVELHPNREKPNTAVSVYKTADNPGKSF